MNIVLSDEDAAVLRDMLTARLGDLSIEIAATDNPGFRQMLRHRRDALVRVRERLIPAPADR